MVGPLCCLWFSLYLRTAVDRHHKAGFLEPLSWILGKLSNPHSNASENVCEVIGDYANVDCTKVFIALMGSHESQFLSGGVVVWDSCLHASRVPTIRKSGNLNDRVKVTYIKVNYPGVEFTETVFKLKREMKIHLPMSTFCSKLSLVIKIYM